MFEWLESPSPKQKDSSRLRNIFPIFKPDKVYSVRPFAQVHFRSVVCYTLENVLAQMIKDRIIQVAFGSRHDIDPSRSGVRVQRHWNVLLIFWRNRVFQNGLDRKVIADYARNE